MKPLIDMNKTAGAVGICTEAGDTPGIRMGADADLTGNRITNLAEPENDQDAATKSYVERRLKALADAMGIEI